MVDATLNRNQPELLSGTSEFPLPHEVATPIGEISPLDASLLTTKCGRRRLYWPMGQGE